ncbi:protein-cysteine N-palmitoyltransferase HHAT-like [Ptychodera flava]|uniref:protein-cysteine N-palmitoyltransferase HHAT-like n=1 Tax=Ptychodera flava TaxID=63121 RepID=UPI00396A07D8
MAPSAMESEKKDSWGNGVFVKLLISAELFICAVFWFSSAGYSIYRVYTASRDNWPTLYEYDLQDGLSIFDRKKDIADFEWQFWVAIFTYYPFVIAMVGHVIMGRLCAAYMPQHRQSVFLLYSLTLLWLLLGTKTFGILIANAVVIYMVALFQIPLLCWMVGIGQVIALNQDPMKQWQQQLYGDQEDHYNLMVFIVAMSNLRFLSFALEYCKLPTMEKRSNLRTLLDLLGYNFYLPLFFCGPVLTYDKFSAQINEKPRSLSKTELLHILKRFLQLSMWVIFIEVWFHFMYFAALQRNYGIFKYLPTWSIAGIGYCQVQFFQVKYVVMFGVPRTVALFDHITAPREPACVSALYTFKDMWRYFDRGLHSWLTRYIYIPLGGAKHGLIHRLVASLACFAYVAYWHGGEDYLYAWCFLNWAGVSFETLVDMFSGTSFAQTIKQNLPEFVVHRLNILLMTPSFVMLIISNLVFLGV